MQPQSTLKLKEEYLSKCPICGKGDLKIRMFEYNIPNYGDSIILVIFCTKCSFRIVDVIPKEVFGRKRIEIIVEGKKDFGKKILKNKGAIIEIPEVGIRMEESEGYITTVEGLLIRIEEKLKKYSKNTYEKVKDKIDRLKRGQERFRIVIEDEEGISKLLD